MISITSVSNVFFSTISNNYIDCTLNTIEYGYIQCTLANTDLTEYNIFNSNTNSYDQITNQQMYINSLNGNYGTLSVFTPNIPEIKQNLYNAVSLTCDYITAQIIPSQTKQLAYQNALFILSGNGGSPPTGTGILATSFNNLASSWGLSPTNFATLITEMQQLSLTLGSLELSTQNQINNSQNISQLNSILTSYESSITTLITEINTLVPIPVGTPNTIQIKGLNI